MKIMSSLLLTLMLAGCANSYRDAYVPAQGVTPESIAAIRKGAAPAEPAVERGRPADVNALVQELTKRGYRGIGQSSFTSSRQVHEGEAIDQGKRVGADLVLLLNPSFAGSTVTAVAKPGERTPAIPTHLCGDSPCPAPEKQASGPATNYVPAPVHHSNYSAIYFALAR